jgi:glucosylglycerate phosphorylase
MNTEMNNVNERIEQILRAVYGARAAGAIIQALAPKLERFRAEPPELTASHRGQASPFNERDVVLITYGDQIQEPGAAPLRTLDEVLVEKIGGLINTVHILPFYPYTSDDGFSVTDYRAVDPSLGDWEDVRRMGAHFRLMFDAVINHMSQASAWFQAYLRNEFPYNNHFISLDPSTDLSQVVRPRTTPLLTPFEAADGVSYVWTTFSADQVDLNYADENLLLEIVDVLLLYVSMGARLIRLDAVAFLWKEIGTSCLHLPQTHQLIRFFRAVLDEAAPGVLLVTETNVPHAENVSYFGNGYDEAQMVYNFTLPPLALDAFHTGDASRLTAWARTLETPSDETAFFNFMASHDGIGLRPVEGILTSAEVEGMAQRVQKHGGYVSYRTNPDGSQSPYELNIVYYDALNDPNADETQDLQVARFLSSQAILLSLAGVPGIYVHSLFGSRNWRKGVAQTGRSRTINRRKFVRGEFEDQLSDPSTVQHQVFAGYSRLLACRTREPSFHPAGRQLVLDVNPALFVLLRTSPDGASQVLCIHNVSDREQSYTISAHTLDIMQPARWFDLLAEQVLQPDTDGTLRLAVAPYGVQWLRAER